MTRPRPEKADVEILSERNPGVVVEAAFGFDRHVVRNRVAAALSVRKPSPRQVERLRQRIVERGRGPEDDESGGGR